MSRGLREPLRSVVAPEAAHETFRQIMVRAADAEQAGRLAAEAYAAGATGLEERECVNGITLILYAPTAVAEAVRDAVAEAAPGIRGRRFSRRVDLSAPIGEQPFEHPLDGYAGLPARRGPQAAGVADRPISGPVTLGVALDRSPQAREMEQRVQQIAESGAHSTRDIVDVGLDGRIEQSEVGLYDVVDIQVVARTGSRRPASISAICRAKLESANASDWPGPL